MSIPYIRTQLCMLSKHCLHCCILQCSFYRSFIIERILFNEQKTLSAVCFCFFMILDSSLDSRTRKMNKILNREIIYTSGSHKNFA